MYDERQALVMQWITVRDETGRERLEARWVTDRETHGPAVVAA